MRKNPKSNQAPRAVKFGSVTVKIYSGHSRGRPIFTVAWHVGLKRFRKVSTNEERAVAYARDVAERLSAGEVQATTITVPEAQCYREAERLLGGSLPVHLAVGEYVCATKRLNGAGSLLEAADYFNTFAARRESVRTVPEVVDEFIAAKSSDGVSRPYMEDLTWRLRRFATAIPGNIIMVMTGEIDDWLRGLKVSLRTRDNYRRVIITLFKFAKRRGHLPRDRDTEAEYTERPKIKQGPIEVFSPSELAEMLAVADGQPKLAVALAAFTGIRSAELLRMTWEDFNWAESVIDLGCDQTKTASRRLVPILPALTAWIEPYIKSRGRVFEYSLPVCLAEAFGTLARKVTEARGTDAEPFSWKANGLRHSYASYRLAITMDTNCLALELGNSPQKIFSNYRKVVTRSQGEAWFSIRPE